MLARAAGVAGVPAPAADRIRAVTALGPGDVPPGKPNDEAGRAQLAYLAAATKAALAGEVAALVTAPISKQWIARAGFAFPGHTEYLASRAGVREFAMMLAGPTPARDGRDHARAAARRREPADRRRHRLDYLADGRRARAALRHRGAARGGRGAEPARRRGRAVRRRGGAPGPPRYRGGARAHRGGGRRAESPGPHVPDVVFRDAAGGRFDAVVALYHDQGLIPLKLLHFDEGVNVTLGLPFVRTSPDHGTAYDIAGSGRASPDSFLAALDLAARASIGDAPV